MANERFKVWLNKGELPTPNTGLDDAGSTTESLLGTDCAGYTAGQYDANGDGVFNLRDYACDDRINLSDTRRSGPSGMLTPEDLTIAFSDGTDADGNGFVDDIAGWDFLDNDNDPYDDVQYGHGTGEAQDSTAEADNGQGDVGSCPNCVVMPLRVGRQLHRRHQQLRAGRPLRHRQRRAGDPGGSRHAQQQQAGAGGRQLRLRPRYDRDRLRRG